MAWNKRFGNKIEYNSCLDRLYEQDCTDARTEWTSPNILVFMISQDVLNGNCRGLYEEVLQAS